MVPLPAPDPWDEWRKRRPEGFFGGLFPREFEQEFERLRQDMERMMADAFRGALPGGVPGARGGAGPNPGQPFVYGFTMRVGPDGRPQLQEFGNTRPVGPEAADGAREPLTDVLDGEREVAVTVELPGVAKEDINLHVGDETVTIRVDAGRKYYKEVRLPAPVVPKTANATFKNGILDLTIEKARPDRDPGFKVNIQ